MYIYVISDINDYYDDAIMVSTKETACVNIIKEDMKEKYQQGYCIQIWEDEKILCSLSFDEIYVDQNIRKFKEANIKCDEIYELLLYVKKQKEEKLLEKQKKKEEQQLKKDLSALKRLKEKYGNEILND